jgi:uncharacterized membrane protein
LLPTHRVIAKFIVDNRGEEMRKSYPVLLIVCTAVFTLAVYQRLPDRMPMHWGPWGSPDAWGGRVSGAILFPVLMVFIWILTSIVATALPKDDDEAALLASLDGRMYHRGSRNRVPVIRNAVMTSFALLQVVILGSALNWWPPMERWWP